jgi:hypothetical protein
MKEMYAGRIATLTDTLDRALAEAHFQEGEVSEDVRLAYRDGFDAVKTTCNFLGLDSTSDQASRIVDSLGNPQFDVSELAEDLFDLRRRFTDELGHYLCLIFDKSEAKLWQNRQPFGPEVYEAFPAATIDIEEAGRCLACHRGTATVFHLMRVMEVGLRATSQALGIPYAPSWESHLKQIQDRINMKWRKRGIRWKRDEPFFRGVLGHLQAVKVAWRNPTMHIVNHYTPEQAEDIFNSVRGFMRHLATRLSENLGGRSGRTKAAGPEGE